MRYPHLSVLALARLFDALQSEVWSALGSAGLDRPRRNAGDELTGANVAEDIAVGLSVQAMARKYETTEREIRRVAGPRIVIRREITPPKREEDPEIMSAMPDPAPEAIARLRAEGIPWRDVSLRLSCRQQTAFRIAAEHGFAGERSEAVRYLERKKSEPAPTKEEEALEVQKIGRASCRERV